MTAPKGRTELGWLRQGGTGTATSHSKPPPSVG